MALLMKTFMKRLRPGDLVQAGLSKNMMNHLLENHLKSRWCRHFTKKCFNKRCQSTNNKHRMWHPFTLVKHGKTSRHNFEAAAERMVKVSMIVWLAVTRPDFWPPTETFGYMLHVRTNRSSMYDMKISETWVWLTWVHEFSFGFFFHDMIWRFLNQKQSNVWNLQGQPANQISPGILNASGRYIRDVSIISVPLHSATSLEYMFRHCCSAHLVRCPIKMLGTSATSKLQLRGSMEWQTAKWFQVSILLVPLVEITS